MYIYICIFHGERRSGFERDKKRGLTGTRRQCGINVLEGPAQGQAGARLTHSGKKHSHKKTLSSTQTKEQGRAVTWFPILPFPFLAAGQPNPLSPSGQGLTYVCISMYKLYTADQVTVSCLGGRDRRGQNRA